MLRSPSIAWLFVSYLWSSTQLQTSMPIHPLKRLTNFIIPLSKGDKNLLKNTYIVERNTLANPQAP